MSKTEQIFLELIRVATGNLDRITTVPTVDEWNEIIDIAVKQAVPGMVYQAIGLLPKEQRPDMKTIYRFFHLISHLEKLNDKLDAHVRKLQLFLESKQMPSCVLKGQGVAQYYPSPKQRVPGDIDIWLGADMKTIDNFLKVAGVKTGEKVYHHVDVQFFKDTDVEVHYRPSWMWNPIHNRRLQKWFRQEMTVQMDNRKPMRKGEWSITAPTRDFDAVYLLLHIYRHFFDEGIGLRQLADYYYCMIHEGDNNEVRRNLKRFGLMKFAAAMMYVMQTVFGLNDENLIVAPNEKLGVVLLNEIMIAGNFGHYDTRHEQYYRRGTLSNLLRKIRHNIHFYTFYPDELLWETPFKVWHYFWRKRQA